MEVLIKKFKEIGMKDLPLVGGKNASLGEMYNELTSKGIQIPNGFATTSDAFWKFMKDNQLEKPLEDLLKDLDRKNFSNLEEIGSGARKLIMDGNLSEVFLEEIIEAYHYLSDKVDLDVAVRSSATAEDLPEASFAGQHDTLLNIRGD